jgi:hypothetical protein
MPDIIRIRNLDPEYNIQDVLIPVDKNSASYDRAKIITATDLKEWILSGYTGGGSCDFDFTVTCDFSDVAIVLINSSANVSDRLLISTSTNSSGFIPYGIYSKTTLLTGVSITPPFGTTMYEIRDVGYPSSSCTIKTHYFSGCTAIATTTTTLPPTTTTTTTLDCGLDGCYEDCTIEGCYEIVNLTTTTTTPAPTTTTTTPAPTTTTTTTIIYYGYNVDIYGCSGNCSNIIDTGVIIQLSFTLTINKYYTDNVYVYYINSSIAPSGDIYNLMAGPYDTCSEIACE